MALELLQSILDAEKSAETLVEGARDRAAGVIKAAEAAAAEQERAAAQKGRELYKEKLEAAAAASQVMLDEESRRRRAAAQTQIREAETRLEGAARLIVREVTHGDR